MWLSGTHNRTCFLGREKRPNFVLIYDATKVERWDQRIIDFLETKNRSGFAAGAEYKKSGLDPSNLVNLEKYD